MALYNVNTTLSSIVYLLLDDNKVEDEGIQSLTYLRFTI